MSTTLDLVPVQDLALALDLGVPRSTAAGWLGTPPPEVVTHKVLDATTSELTHEVLSLRRRLRGVSALARVLVVALRVGRVNLSQRSLSPEARCSLVRAVERARSALSLRTLLIVLALPASSFHAWAREDARCRADAGETCLRRAPNQLTPEEERTIREMVTSADYRHVPISRLALLAQRLGKVFASTSTWYRLVRERGWRRPRLRVHPLSPKVGLCTSRPNEAWHVDVTLIRLLDGTKLYLHGVVDNFSRKILAWSLAARLEAATCAAVLRDAIATAGDVKPEQLVVDGGSENYANPVDELVAEHLLRRLRAQSTELRFSNSPIEAFWSSLKHQWLYDNHLDTEATVRKLVAFFVHSHNSDLPHSAFSGQTPDEMYLGTGTHVPHDLAAARATARAARLAANRDRTCATCPRSRDPAADDPAA